MKGFKTIMEFFLRYCVSKQRSHNGRNGNRSAPWTGGSPHKESALPKTAAKPAETLCPQCGQPNPADAPDCAHCGATLPLP
jgi:hypothetical protein